MTTPTTPPTVDALPAAPSTNSPSTFDTLADAFLGALATFRDQLIALAANVFGNATIAKDAADTAIAQVSTTTTKANEASASAAAAAASASTALNAPGTSATSTTSLTIGTGSKSLTIQTGKSISVGASVIIAYTTTPTTRMSGTVTSYDSVTGALVVNVDTIIGSGTQSAWTVSLGNVSQPVGGLVLLATLTPTAAANVDFLSVFTSSYDNYMIIGDGILPAADGRLVLRLSTGGTVDTGSNYSSLLGKQGATSTTTSTLFYLTYTTLSAGKGCSFITYVCNTNDATNLKMVDSDAISQNNASPGWYSLAGCGAYFAANTVSGGRLFWDVGSNFSATGKIRIYGISNA